MVYANTKNKLYKMCEVTTKLLEELIQQIEDNHMQNEQFVLNFLDRINELSVKF